MNMMSERDAAAYLRSRYGFGTQGSLRQMRYEGKGPRFYRCGSAKIYTKEALDAWCLGRMKKVTTAA